MGTSFKKLYWAGGLGILLSLLLAVAVIVPRVVDSAWLKSKIQTEVTKQVDGDFDFQKAELSILPLPAVSLRKVSLSIPETARIKLENLKVYPKLLPLLIGKIQIDDITVVNPNLSLPLPEKKSSKKPQTKAFSLSAILDNVFAKLSPVMAAIPDLEIGVKDGAIRLFSEDKQIFHFENIDSEIYFSPKSLTFSISCRSNIWESMQLNAKLTPDSQEGKGEILLENTNNKVVIEYFLPGGSPLLTNTFSTLEVKFTVNPKNGLTADIKSSGSTFAALYEDKKITAKVGNIKANIQHTDGRSSLTLEDITLLYPQVQLSGSFTFDRTIPQVVLDISSKNSDIKSVNEVLPIFLNAIYGELPFVDEIFAIIRGGTITEASLNIEGKSPSDLAFFEAMLIQGHIANADVSLSDLGLNLQGVTGEAAIANGILKSTNLQARVGKTTGTDGSLQLGLIKKETTPFHLDLQLHVDLADAFPIMKQTLPNENIQRYLALFESYEGTAKGHLILGESLESLNVQANVDTINVRGKLKPVPYPITIDGGRIVYDGLKTESHDMQGRIGKSSFSQYSSSINMAGDPNIHVNSGTFHIVMGEIYPWLASYEMLSEELEDIKNLTGIAEVTVKSIKGPIFSPADLEYELLGNLQNVTLDAKTLPGTLNIKSGQFHIIPDKISFENFEAGLLDSSLTYSGVLQNFITGRTNAEIIVTEAILGQGAYTWLVHEIGAPEEYQFKTPLLISRAQAKWTREELLDLQGDFSIKSGPMFSVDVMLNSDELLLRDLSLQNGADRATIKLELAKRKIDTKFQGSLSKKTIDAILLNNDAFPDAWLKGDIRLQIDMDSPAASAVSGTLDGGDFIFPWNLNKPLLLNSFSLAAGDNTLAIQSAEASFEGKSYSINGTASLAQKNLALDFDMKTDTIELDKILDALNEEERDEQLKEKRVGKDWALGVHGNIRLHADSLLYNRYSWLPFESLLTIGNSSLGIEVLKAELCHIATPGTIFFQDDQIALDFRMEAAGQEFNDVLICLEGGEKQMTGTMDLKASISGKGSKDTLVNSLAGNLQYSSHDGYIYQDAKMAKLLYVLNITNMFKGKIPDLATKGFHYDSLIVMGTMENGILTISPARLDAPIMEISAYGTIDIPREKVDIQVLVAPLQTVNKLQQMLPVISKIVPESLVAVPVEVKGEFSDIKVRTLSMSSISKSVFGTMVDALSTPVRVLEDERQK